MSKTIETTLKIAQDFMIDPKYVYVSKMGISKFIDDHKNKVLVHKKKIEKNRRKIKPEDITLVVLMELITDSINYNFWYGKYDIRPKGSSSSKMANLLLEAYEETKDYVSLEEYLIDSFIKKLSIERYPNLENRIKHLREVAVNRLFVSRIASNIKNGTESLADLDNLIMSIPGFADDIFLKRAFLFFISLNRYYGFYEKDIAQIPIPADYQIPKVLNCLGILEYNAELESKIEAQELIPEGSRMECEIRSGAILACKEMAEKMEVTPSDIDDYLFGLRDDFKDKPFHLTITTWY